MCSGGAGFLWLSISFVVGICVDICRHVCFDVVDVVVYVCGVSIGKKGLIRLSVASNVKCLKPAFFRILEKTATSRHLWRKKNASRWLDVDNIVDVDLK